MSRSYRTNNRDGLLKRLFIQALTFEEGGYGMGTSLKPRDLYKMNGFPKHIHR